MSIEVFSVIFSASNIAFQKPVLSSSCMWKRESFAEKCQLNKLYDIYIIVIFNISVYHIYLSLVLYSPYPGKKMNFGR